MEAATTAATTIAAGIDAVDDATSVSPPKAKKIPPSHLVIPPKAKPLTKAERRALQESQRAAKATSSSATTRTSPTTATTTTKYDATVATTKTSHSNSTSTRSVANAASGEAHPTTMTSSCTSSRSSTASGNCEKGIVTATLNPTMTLTPAMAIVSHLPPPYPISFDTGAVLAPTVSEHDGVQPSSSSSVPVPVPAVVVQLGYAYATGAIRGGNARCRAMLTCFATLLTQSQPPVSSPSSSSPPPSLQTTGSDARALIDPYVLKPAFTYWTHQCRPHSVSMGNAYAFLKTYLQCLDRDLPWNVVVTLLLETMHAYRRERIDYALTAIAETACTKLLVPQQHYQGTNTLTGHTSPGKNSSELVILTYGYSEAVCAVLLQLAVSIHAAATATTTTTATSTSSSSHYHTRLRVICADSPPLWEGRRMLHRLLSFNDDATTGCMDCSYIPLSAVTYVLPTVTKVLLGAAALQSDGSCTGRIGTAVVAMMAAPHCPVLVCAETHKISNRGVQLESITHNERLLWPVTTTIGTTTTDNVTTGTHDETPHDDTDTDPVQRLDLLYDLTPAAYVSGIVTELGIVPPSSIAVLLREMNINHPNGTDKYG